MAEMSREEQIGFHKGALTTLIKERQELARILNIVDRLIQAHLKALEQLGVKVGEEKETNELEGLLK